MPCKPHPMRELVLTHANSKTHSSFRSSLLTQAISGDLSQEWVYKFILDQIPPNLKQPYVAEHSRSIYARLGSRIGFFGIDARTEVRYRTSWRFRSLTEVAYEKTSQLSRDLPDHIRSITKRAQCSQILLLSYPALDRPTWNSHRLSRTLPSSNQ